MRAGGHVNASKNRPRSCPHQTAVCLIHSGIRTLGDPSDKGKVEREIKEIEKDFEEAIRLDPSFGAAYLGRGECRLYAEKWDDALQDFEKCVGLDPTVHGAYARLGKQYERKNKYYHALASYAEEVKLDPKGGYRLSKEAAAGVVRLTKKVRETWEKPALKVISIDLDPDLKKVAVKRSPPITLAPDTEKVVEDTIRVRHTTSITDTWKGEIEVRGKVTVWRVETELVLRGGIEKATNRTFGVETETKRSVTIKGTKSGGTVRVVWVDYYRTGKAKIELDGQVLELPFEFKEDFDLLTEAANPNLSK